MVKLKEYKGLSENQAIIPAPLPERVIIPLAQHIGKIAEPNVKIGQKVLTGQEIGFSSAAVSSSIHASISGQIVAIGNYAHPVLGESPAIVIQSDGQDQKAYSGRRTQAEVERLTPEEIRQIVQQAGIVGMGGAAFPSHIKLNPPKPISSFILNAAECEPYLTSDYRLMVEKTEEIILGMQVIIRCLQAKEAFIAIEENKPEAIKKFKNYAYPVKVLPAQYPQGGEKQLIKNVLNKEVPAKGGLPLDIGVVVHNLATVYAIYEAVYLNKPLFERVVTVTGNCLTNPKNLLVRIGTSFSELLKLCAPFKEEPFLVVMGGLMMGIAQASADVPVIKATNGILVLSKVKSALFEEGPCIRCAACVRNCPVGLLPCIIDAASRKEDWQLALDYGALECIECGVCSYVCPAHRLLVQAIKLAKFMNKRSVVK